MAVALALVAVGLAAIWHTRDGPHVPTYGVMGFPFGRPVQYQDCGFHTGQDWFAPAGMPVFAIADGTVIHVGPLWWDAPGAGRGPYAIVIDHGDYVTTYSHSASANVTAGQQVRRGQRIASVGSLGYSRAPHLHLEKVTAPWTGDWQRPFDGCDGYADPGMVWGWF